MRNYLIIIGLMLIVVQGMTSAEESTDSSGALPPTVTKQDSSASKSGDTVLSRLEDTLEQTRNEINLKKVAIRSADADLDKIDDDIDELADKIDELEDRINELRHSKCDTVDAEVVIKKIQDTRKFFSEKVTKARAQGFGGGAIIQPMLIGIRMKPVNELIHNSSALNGYRFSGIDDGYNLMVVTGGIGFGGVGNGIRIGFGGWGGESNYNGEKAYGVKDSVLKLTMHIGYGGMLVEKAFVHKNFNFITGGMFGGGSITLNRKVKSTSGFKSSWADFDSGDSDDQAKATYTGLELHSGFTVSVMPWLHIGTDVNGTFLLSISGFDGSGGDGFRGFNPGLRLRIVLGNLG